MDDSSLEPTADPTCFIEKREGEGKSQSITYRNLDGERWVIRGLCIACGECEVGAVNPNLVWTGISVGEPGACLDSTFGTRLDVPIRPELTRKMPHCTLEGEYLHGD